MSEAALNEIAEALAAEQEAAVIGCHIAHGELTVEARPEHIVRLLTWLRDEGTCQFRQLIDLCGADYPARRRRFDVVYHLLSMQQNLRIRVKVQTDEETPVPTVTGIFPVADWFEREAFDMYGILFADHPDLRRILTDYGFRGHPLRKDFPVTGYVEVRYDEEKKRVVYEPVQLVQEFRAFDFMSPWEGAEYILPGDEKAGEKAN